MKCFIIDIKNLSAQPLNEVAYADSEGKEKSLNMQNNADLLTKSPLRYGIMIITEAAYYAARKNEEVRFCPNCGKER